MATAERKTGEKDTTAIIRRDQSLKTTRQSLSFSLLSKRVGSHPNRYACCHCLLWPLSLSLSINFQFKRPQNSHPQDLEIIETQNVRVCG